MQVIATKNLRYLGVSYKPGQEVPADDHWGDLLVRAKLARRTHTADVAPRSAPAGDATPRRGRGRPKGSTNKPAPTAAHTEDE